MKAKISMSCVLQVLVMATFAHAENTKAQNGLCVPNILPRTGGKVHGFKCLKVAKGSALDKAGVGEGDIVLSIDGQVLTSPEQVHKISAGKYKEFVIISKGQEITIRVADSAPVGGGK